MEEALIRARGLSKRYGGQLALDDVSLQIERGQIVGLIGPNGAGKTTALKAIMGLVRHEGTLEVLGLNPHRHRHRLMHDVCFIADVAVLPPWLKVSQALDLMAGLHPRFNRGRAQGFLDQTEIGPKHRVRQLSKGMVTQLHLALVMGIEARILVLDEPTLGLDIIYRQAFYEQLLNDYFDDERTIILTTHQVEEIERILTHVLFINHGRIVLDAPMDELPERFGEVAVNPERLDAARALAPLHERQLFGQHVFVFEDVARERLAELGEVRMPGIADVFVAKMKGAA